MKRICGTFLTIVLMLGLCACGQDVQASWQEQYDLGIKYLSEGNYEEAVIAFTAAIEIDAKRPEAFIGRGDAYALSGDTEDNLAAAQTDYEAAIALDETLPGGWLGLADVYIRRGDYDKAMEILREALEKTGNDQKSIADKLSEMEGGTFTDSMARVRRSNSYDLDGTLINYTEYAYNEAGKKCGWKNYASEGTGETFTLTSSCEVTFGANGLPERNQFFEADGTPSHYDTFVYDEAGRKKEQYRYEADGNLFIYFNFYYDANGRESKYEEYWPDGSMISYYVSEYDDAGRLLKETRYSPEGEIMSYDTFD